MAVAIHPEITNLDRVLSHVANQRWPHQKAVAIILDARPIVVVVQAALNGEAFAYEVLSVKIGDVNILVPRVETIETAVGVLLKHRKIGRVVLITIVAERPKQTRAQIVIGKNEAAKIRNERLNACAH